MLSAIAVNQIHNIIQEHYNAVIEFVGTSNAILGVFAYGSMNYGTFQLGKSDVDTKAIIIPSFDNCIFDHPISKELHIDNAHCEVKDIRLMIDCYKKQNINFVETLFTEFFIINPLYQNIWNRLQLYKNDIAHYNEYQCIQSVVGQALHTYKQIKDWNGKKYANLLRLIDFLHSYCLGLPYEICLKPKHLDLIKQVKYSDKPCLTQEQLDKIYNTLLAYQKKEIKEYKLANKQIKFVFDNILDDMIKMALIQRMLY